MKFNLLLTALAVLLLTAVQAKNSTEIKGFENPESIIAYKDHLFVSNTGVKLEPLAKDGDGYISMLSREDGKIIELKFISNLNSPKGMFIRKGVLYVADVDKIQGFKISTKEKVFEADLNKYGVSYANDITRAFRGMFVSATLKSAIFKVKANGKIKELKIKGDFNGANGLDRKRIGKLAIANYGNENQPNGSFGKIGLITKKYKEFQKEGIYDGIIRKCGKLYVTDWINLADNKGRLIEYKRHCKKGIKEIKLDKSIGGPSDIFADKKTKLLWIPSMIENKIIAVPFSDLKNK
jgi:hypothetical protein